mmetsp:Transcript_4640/g.11248  ORF Transcript_4640/g.11248 Transcript_4640/m.11248 type:complete len:322 (+) Transcript_4640:1754-2719(+)
MGPGELVHAVRQFQDKFVTRVICHGIKTKLTECETDPLSVLQIIADIWAMQHALIALDDYAAEQGRKTWATSGGSSSSSREQRGSHRGGSRGTKSRSFLTVNEGASTLEALKKSAVTMAAAGLCKDIDAIFSKAAASANWMPERSPELRCSSHMEKAIMKIQEAAQEAARNLPTQEVGRMRHAMVTHLANCIVTMLQGDAVTRYNIHAIRRLDADLAAAEDFATCLSLGRGQDLREEFALVRSAVHLLLQNKVAEAVEDRFQANEYAALVAGRHEMLTAASILEKYREGSSMLARSGAQQEQPRRRDVERAARYLRDAAAG